MNILFHLGHPAHFHLFKNTINYLKGKGHDVIIAIKKKDILEELLQNANLEYIVLFDKKEKTGKLASINGLLIQDYRLLKISLKNKVDILIGTSIAITHVGKLLNISSIYVGEDDWYLFPAASKISMPYASVALCPVTCSKGKWEYKKIGYDGYQKLAYLHPTWFTPDKAIAEKYIDISKPYFLIRLAKLNAHHDKGATGINTEIAQNIINILEPYGNIYITSERALEPQFEKYRLKIDPLYIHHVLYFAQIYLGDSQSMAVEAAMLGTPSIRFNDFAGKISVLEELEHKYELTFGIKTSTPDKLYAKLKELLEIHNLGGEFKLRQEKMLSDKIDVTSFFIWFIENYPESKKIMTENPDYQYNFK